ncbi:MAG: AzlD domain-containing protein [Acidimicrobiales bacterium]
MSWAALLLLATGAFAFKAAGNFGVGSVAANPIVVGLGRLLPPALLAALIIDGTLNSGGSLVLDERAAGVMAGGIAAYFKAPFWLVVVLAATVTGVLRQF